MPGHAFTKHSHLLTTMLLWAGLAVGCAKPATVPNISEAPSEVRAVPTPEEFTLGPGDQISIRVWRHDDLDMDVTIAPDGTITYPLVGQLQVAEKTYTELVGIIRDAVKTYYSDPQVSVNIIELTNQKVLVIGEVSTPSVLQLSTEMSILEALTRSGGINTNSRTDNVLLIRGGLTEPELYTVDVQAIYTKGATDQVVYLKRGDIVVVPPKTITNVARYFKEVQSVLSPFVAGSAIFV